MSNVSFKKGRGLTDISPSTLDVSTNLAVTMYYIYVH